METSKTQINWKEVDKAGDDTAWELLDQVKDILEPKLRAYLFGLTEGEWIWIGLTPRDPADDDDDDDDERTWEATEIPYSDPISSEVILTEYENKECTVYERRISEAGKKKLFDLLLSAITELGKETGVK